MATPTKRSLDRLKQLGFEAGVVERFNSVTKRRHDLLGVIDIVAVREGIGVLGVQATSGDNHASRRTKALAEPRLRTWLASGGRFEIFSWSKKGKAGKRKLWELRREEIFLHDLDPAEEREDAMFGKRIVRIEF